MNPCRCTVPNVNFGPGLQNRTMIVFYVRCRWERSENKWRDEGWGLIIGKGLSRFLLKSTNEIPSLTGFISSSEFRCIYYLIVSNRIYFHKIQFVSLPGILMFGHFFVLQCEKLTTVQSLK